MAEHQDEISAHGTVSELTGNEFSIDYQPNRKGRNYDTYVIAGDVTIGGEPNTVGVVLIRRKNDSRLYNHEITTTKIETQHPSKPGQPKKHRPAYLLQVICDDSRREELENIIFRETTSIGFRRYRQARRVLPREIRIFESSMGPVRVKFCRHLDQTFAYPEYEDVAGIAEKTNKPFREIMETIRDEADRERPGF